MHLAAFAQGNHALGHRPIGKVNPQRDERQPPLLGPHCEPMQLPAMQQQLPHPLGRMIPKRRLPILVNLAIDQPQLPILEPRISLLDAASTVPQALDLAAMEHQPTLDRIEHLIVVLGLAVLGDTLKSRPGDRRSFRSPRLGRASRRFAFGLRVAFGRGRLWFFLVQTSASNPQRPEISKIPNVEFSCIELGYNTGNRGGDCPPTRLSINT